MSLVKKLSYRFLKLKFQIFEKFGVQPTFQKGGRCVLNYHGVVDSDELRFNSRFISTKTFEAHLNYFKTHFNVVSLIDLQAGINLSQDRFNIALTFDDGLQNNFTRALPILRKYETPATFCVCSAEEPVLWSDLLDLSCSLFPTETVHLFNEECEFEKDGARLKQRMLAASEKQLAEFHTQLRPCLEKIAEDEELTPFWKLLTKEELTELSKEPLIQLVAHGKNHLVLPSLTDSEIQQEVLDSIQNVVQFGGDAFWFCYPNGKYSEETISLLRSLGVKHQIIVDSNGIHSEDLIARFVVNPHLSVSGLLYFLARGHYGYGRNTH